MHAVLLLYRSVVLAAATPDVSAGSGSGGDGDGGGGAAGDNGVGQTSLDFAIHTTKRVDHTLVLGGVGNHGTKNAEKTSINLLHAEPSISKNIEWVAAQSSADAEAATVEAAQVAAAAKKGIDTATEVGMESGGNSEGGDCMVELGGGSAGCVGANKLTPEQVQSAQDIAGQLDTEVRQRVNRAWCRSGSHAM